MSLVPAVTELILAELLYLQYDNPTRPVYMYINSAGVTVSPQPALCLHTYHMFAYHMTLHSVMSCVQHLLQLAVNEHADRHLLDCLL